MNLRAAALLAFLLLPATVLAQSRTWSITTVPAPGDTAARVVMDEVSELTLDVRNTSNNNSRRITSFALALPTGYVVLPSTAPAGWTVTTNAAARSATFTTSCADPGLGQNTGVRVTLRMIPSAAAADVQADGFATTGTFARDACQTAEFTTDLTAAASRWIRSGLATSVSVRPSALGVGTETSARVVIENRTTGAHGGVSVTAPDTGTSGVGLQVVDTQPASVTVPQSGAGVLTSRWRATTGGLSGAQVRATQTTGTVSSGPASTQVLDVEALAVSVDVSNLQIATGNPVQIRATVTNSSATDSFVNVRPRALGFQGSATLALGSGPVPASVDRLAPGASAHFVWSYNIGGAVGADYTFQVQVDASRNGSAVTSALVSSARGQIPMYRVVVSPSSVAANAVNQTVTYQVFNRGTTPIREVRLLRPAANYFTVSGTTAPTGWTPNLTPSAIVWTSTTGIPLNGSRIFTVAYSGFGAAPSLPGPTTFRHRMQLSETVNGTPIRIEAPVTLLAGNAPEVERLTAVARDGSVTLTWDNPALHGGVLVLRAENEAPDTAPTAGLSYTVGSALGNATVVHVDSLSAAPTFGTASTFTDTTVTNGTTYYYRVHNADDSRWYSAGNRPTSAALVATPQARVGGAPLWCYSVGLDARQQPITELGVGVYSAFNNSVVANLTQPTNPAQDGAERWRPLPLTGLIGSRFPVVPLRGLPGQYLMVGDQAGVAYAIHSSTGQVLWRWDNGGSPIGPFQSFPVTQLHDFANAEYQAAHPGRDLVFFATRLENPAQNRVVALNAATGALVWTYQPGDLGMVSGGMVVDYATNRLFVGSMTHGGSSDSLRVISTLTGVEAARRPVGDIELSLVRNTVTNHLLATSSDGMVHALDVATLAPAWSIDVADRPAPNTPAFTSFVRPQGGGFVASLASGQVAFYESLSAAEPTLKWSTPVPNPSGVFSLNRNGVARIYVGGADGRVHQLELETGTDSQQVSIGGAQRIGTPTIDSGVGRLHVGSEDGRICAFPVPFP